MYKYLSLLALCCSVSIIRPEQNESVSVSISIIDKEQERAERKDFLNDQLNRFFTKIERLKNHPTFSIVSLEIDIDTIFAIAQDYAKVIQSLTRAEYIAFFAELDQYAQSQKDEGKDDIEIFLGATELLQQKLLPQYCVPHLFLFGILYESFDDYIHINQEFYRINS